MVLVPDYKYTTNNNIGDVEITIIRIWQILAFTSILLRENVFEKLIIYF